MNSSDKNLARKLALAVALKLILLVVLWWVFFRGQGPSVESGEIAARLLSRQTHQEEGNAK